MSDERERERERESYREKRNKHTHTYTHTSHISHSLAASCRVSEAESKGKVREKLVHSLQERRERGIQIYVYTLFIHTHA